MAKTPAAKGTKVDVEIARVLARVYWREVVVQTNPTLGKEERKANWAETRQQYMKLARKVLRSLERSGYAVKKTA